MRCSTPKEFTNSRARSSSEGRNVSLFEVTARTLPLGNALAQIASASEESTPPENATSALP
jgi:hypothetical protein